MQHVHPFFIALGFSIFTVTILICPGMHTPSLTDRFLSSLGDWRSASLVVPSDRYPPFSGWHITEFLKSRLATAAPRTAQPLVLIGFSAGVVGAIGAAHLWQAAGGAITALIAIDGWGVPLYGNFPIHRLSHDAFTHWSSACLGGDQNYFYAEPAVDHLTMWETPQNVRGWCGRSADFILHGPQFSSTAARCELTAAEFLRGLLAFYHASTSLTGL